ncbi:hypothetical protein J437_LFUL004383 [Ladona fulva]|uniref:Uncharacterized protein n=1 Tax=Ladona fulva TaxID=123851 RepID=A0A8K0K2E6_LADFU|nr:hypothetical protein J437_LFUL004383 [Ladona fulva]
MLFIDANLNRIKTHSMFEFKVNPSGKDIFVTPREWCRCFDKTDRPCTAVRRRITPDLLESDVFNKEMISAHRPFQRKLICRSSFKFSDWAIDGA